MGEIAKSARVTNRSNFPPWGIGDRSLFMYINPQNTVLALRKIQRSMVPEGIRTDKAPAPVGPYNQATIATGRLLFVSGQIPLDPQTNEIVYPQDAAKQAEQVMANMEAILQAAGANWQQVVKINIYLADMNDFARVNQAYGQYFDAENAPARACIQVAGLPKNSLVEMECIAALDP